MEYLAALCLVDLTESVSPLVPKTTPLTRVVAFPADTVPFTRGDTLEHEGQTYFVVGTAEKTAQRLSERGPEIVTAHEVAVLPVKPVGERREWPASS